MPHNADYTIHTERWCQFCNVRTPQISSRCRYTTPETLKLRNYVLEGWEYVNEPPNGEAIIRLPSN